MLYAIESRQRISRKPFLAIIYKIWSRDMTIPKYTVEYSSFYWTLLMERILRNSTKVSVRKAKKWIWLIIGQMPSLNMLEWFESNTAIIATINIDGGRGGLYHDMQLSAMFGWISQNIDSCFIDIVGDCLWCIHPKSRQVFVRLSLWYVREIHSV